MCVKIRMQRTMCHPLFSGDLNLGLNPLLHVRLMCPLPQQVVVSMLGLHRHKCLVPRLYVLKVSAIPRQIVMLQCCRVCTTSFLLWTINEPGLRVAFTHVVALFEWKQRARGQAHELTKNYKRLTSEKASLEEEVTRLQSSEMANRATSTESRADELNNKVNELKEELDKAQIEKESRILTTKEEAGRVEDLACGQEALDQMKVSYQRSISIAQAQGTEWLLGLDTFQDAIAIMSMNTTTQIYDDIRKSLLPLVYTTILFKWELNEDGVLVWPLTIPEEGEDLDCLPSFDAWVAMMPIMEAEPSSTPPLSQPAPSSARDNATSSILVDLTDD
ncbi:hypothetical protein SLEP1_g39490 [Rubroshorea leprosula]|uniref:Uncharacterized protein n=1 Tax=Rubroshorea leprosula TaxID=152421 RepID=A0AAV5L0K4_9ROSI|nr:hypothetical protein SLEP1_g39490 [Rubroshorea leprosula]